MLSTIYKIDVPLLVWLTTMYLFDRNIHIDIINEHITHVIHIFVKSFIGSNSIAFGGSDFNILYILKDSGIKYKVKNIDPQFHK